jgi:hypothetical protein
MPDVDVVVGAKEKPPTRRQREIRQHVRATVGQVGDVKAREEVGVLGQISTSPDVPATGSALWS